MQPDWFHSIQLAMGLPQDERRRSCTQLQALARDSGWDQAAQSNLLGILADLLGEPGRARSLFLEALSARPQWAVPQYNLAKLAAEGRHHAEAAEAFAGIAKVPAGAVLQSYARHGEALHTLLARRDPDPPPEPGSAGSPMRLEIPQSSSSRFAWVEVLDLARARVVGVPGLKAVCGHGDLVAYQVYLPYALREQGPDALVGAGSTRAVETLQPAGFTTFEVRGPVLNVANLVDLVTNLRETGYVLDPWSHMWDSPIHDPTGPLHGGLAIRLGQDPAEQAFLGLQALEKAGRRWGMQLCAPDLAALSGDELATRRHSRAAHKRA